MPNDVVYCSDILVVFSHRPSQAVCTECFCQ